MSTPLPTAPSSPTQAGYHRLANRLLSASVVGLVLGVAVAYPWASRFPLGVQVLAHLSIPVAAGVLKLGYVMRLATAPTHA